MEPMDTLLSLAAPERSGLVSLSLHPLQKERPMEMFEKSFTSPSGDSSSTSLMKTPRLLVVDDDQIVCETLGEALAEAGYRVALAFSAEEAIERLHSEEFDLVMSDLVMPGMSGLELCSHLSEVLPDLPFVLITGYGTADIAKGSLNRGAADFISKPINMSELPIVVERNLERQRLQAQRLLECSEAILIQAVEALVQALDERDNLTAHHSTRVAQLSVTMGRILDLSEDQLYALRLAALLHDVGKIGVRDQVLLKEGHLEPEEFHHMKQHPFKGAQILARIQELSEVVSAVLHHHENFDGSGYPDGLSGEAIPLFSRIIRVADSWDAMLMRRPYRAALTHDVARNELLKGTNTAYDPQIIEIFLQHIAGLYKAD